MKRSALSAGVLAFLLLYAPLPSRADDAPYGTNGEWGWRWRGGGTNDGERRLACASMRTPLMTAV